MAGFSISPWTVRRKGLPPAAVSLLPRPSTLSSTSSWTRCSRTTPCCASQPGRRSHLAAQVSSALLRYQKGFFLFLSQDVLSPPLAASCIQALLPLFPESFIGVSDIHFQVEDTGNALQEALYAAQIHQLKRQNPILEPAPYQNYAELGIYQVLFPVLDHESFPRYARRILEPLLEFDAENRGNLTRTLLDFVQCGGDLPGFGPIYGST